MNCLNSGFTGLVYLPQPSIRISDNKKDLKKIKIKKINQLTVEINKNVLAKSKYEQYTALR